MSFSLVAETTEEGAHAAKIEEEVCRIADEAGCDEESLVSTGKSGREKEGGCATA